MNSTTNYNDEATYSVKNPDAQKWMDHLATLDDRAVSREIYHKIMESDLDPNDKRLFQYSYDYCSKLISQNKSLDPELFKIYLKDIKGQDIDQVNIIRLFMLLGMCGIEFK